MATLTPGRWTPSSKGQLVPTVSWVLPSAHHPGLRHDPEPTSAWPGFHHQFICCPGHQAVTQNWSHPALPPTCPLTTSQPGWLGGWATLPDLCTWWQRDRSRGNPGLMICGWWIYTARLFILKRMNEKQDQQGWEKSNPFAFFMQRNHSTGKSSEIWFSSVTSGVRGRGLDSQVPINATELLLQYFP